jgi:hypothetical protein
MQRLRSVLRRRQRVAAAALTLIALALLVAAYVGAYRVAAGYATAVEVTIARPNGAVVYHRTITDGEQVRRIQHILNNTRAYGIFDNGPICSGAYPLGPSPVYYYNFSFSIAGVTTQAFTTQSSAEVGCLLQRSTLGFMSISASGYQNPLTASGWSALLGISPTLPDVPPGAFSPVNEPTPTGMPSVVPAPSLAAHM